MRFPPSFAIILFSALVIAGVPAPARADDPVGPKLTPRLKELLTSEMQQVAKATSELALAIANGDHQRVAELGAKIRDSFILKQSLTSQDKKDLMGAVPMTFIALDRRFHGLAGKMASAAQNGDTELQTYYYGRMLEACTQCHVQFAADRFVGFANQ